MQIFRPGDPGYDEERSGFQAGVQHAPQVIFAVRTAEDIREAVDHAETNGIEYEVQATGHGLTTPTGGALISTKRMNEIRIDPATKTARVEAGAVWRQVVAAAGEHGLAPLSGDQGSVGVVGYTLGGGFPLLGREFGPAQNRVTKTERIGEVVTAMEFALVPLAPIHLGELHFDATHAEVVFDAFHRWDVPDHVTPWLTKIGNVVRLTAASSRQFDLYHFHVAPRLVEELKEVPFREAYGHELPPHAYQGDNVLLTDLPRAGLQELRKRADNTEAPTFLSIGVLGGAYENASHVVKVISPQVGVEDQHAEVLDTVRPQTLGRARNFVFGRQSVSAVAEP